MTVTRDILTDLGAVFLGSRMKRLADRLQADAVRINRTAGVSAQPGQLAVLAALDRYGPLSVTALGEALGISQPAVTRTVLGLVDLGWLSASRDDDDLRHKTLDLTAGGRDVVARVGAGSWPRIGAAVTAICDDLSGSLLDQLAGLEAALDARSLEARAALLGPPPGLSIRDFDDSLADDFHRINAEWIETMFSLEANDIDMLSHPRERIIDRDGVILFVEAAGAGIVGTCALIRIAPGCYELTKMGVTEAARGRKAGEFLLQATLDRARAMGIETLYLLTSHKCGSAIHLYEKLGFVHDAGIMERFGSRYARCDVAMLYRPR